jgi:hypothetical protein
MKWVGYGLQGIGGVIALTGIGVFAVGKLVERAATGRAGDDELEGPTDVEVVAVL